MPAFIQRRNSALTDNFRSDFLPLKDRNLYVELFNNSIATAIVTTGALTVPFANTRFNCASDMFTVGSDQITLERAGLYEFFYKFNVGTGSGAVGETSVSTWLEQDTGAGFSEVPGSRSYGYAPPTPGWNNVLSRSTLMIQNTQVPSIFRVRAIVVSPAGTPTAQIHQEGRIFRITNVIGLY